MAQTTISVRMDEQLKRDFDSVCDELGMTISAAITMMAKKMTREHRLPFEVSVDPSYTVDPLYSKSNMEFLRKGIEELNAGRGVCVTLEELEQMTLEEMDQLALRESERDR